MNGLSLKGNLSIPPWQGCHLADKQITARELNAHVRPARTKLQKSSGACTILMTKIALYAVPHVHVKSEVYFGLNSKLVLKSD